MSPTSINPSTAHTAHTAQRRIALLTAGLLSMCLAMAACSSSSTSGTSTQAVAIDGNSGPVLPVVANPIDNSSTVHALTIDSVLVENNVDSAGQAAGDHLEIALTNSGAAELTGVEVFYTFTDPTTNVSESYYTTLPADFTIPAGTRRIAHFDNTGGTDHFPVNEFSVYYTDTNALDVTVVVSASGAAVQTITVHKDAGGAETAD